MLFAEVVLEKKDEIPSESKKLEAIQTLIARYKQSLEQGNINGLKACFRNFTTFEEKKWSDMFKSATDTRVNIAIENTDLSGENPKADLLVRVVYLDNKNRQQQMSNAYTWILEQTNGEWIVYTAGSSENYELWIRLPPVKSAGLPVQRAGMSRPDG